MMIVCAECGTRNAPGTQFCGECGSFLEWEGEPQDQPVPPAPVATTTATTATTTTAARSTGTATAPPAEDKPPVVEEAPPLVQPQDFQQRYRRTEDEPDTLAPGEIACRGCGAGNLATRKFCRICGNSLAAPVEAAKVPWWRRLWQWLTRRNRYEAGTRRKVRDRARWVRPVAVLAVLALALVAAWTVLPTRTYLDRAMTGLRDRTAKHVPVTPVALRASSAAKGAGPELVSDGVSNRFWSPARGPAGQWIEADFDRPVRLLDLIVTGGVSTDKEKFLTQGRPRDVVLTLTGADGKATTRQIVVQDQPGTQTFAVKVSDVVRARLTIASGYEMRAPTKCAIGELEFFIRG